MESLSSLSLLAGKLNQTTDIYMQSLTAVESRLREMNLGVETWLEISESIKSGSPECETSLRKLLGYAKLADGWSLAIKTVRVERRCWKNDAASPWENIYEQDPPKPLLKASRDLRIEAAEYVPRLLESLELRVKELIKSVIEADAQLRQFEKSTPAVNLVPVLQWNCTVCGEMLLSPRERCRCPVIHTKEGDEINPPRKNATNREQ